MKKHPRLNYFDELSRRECIMFRINNEVYALDFLFAEVMLKDCGILTHKLALRNARFAEYIALMNHEIWAVCPVCGYEHDMRIWGDTCPECARRKMKDIRKIRTNRHAMG